MRILITGGAGYVGSACLRHLAREGHEVMAFDNLVEGHPDAVDGHPLVEGDIADTEKLTATLKDFGADAVMHFAAATSVGESVHKPEYHYANNIGGTLSLLEAMRTAGVGRMLFSSTCATYGDVPPGRLSEDLPQNPVSPYARTKLAVEWMISDFAQAHGLGFTLLRYFNACGAEPSGAFGEYHDPETHLIPLVLETALGRRDKIMIFGDDYPTPDGTCIRDYVHIHDLASAHRLAIEATDESTEAVYNIGTGQGNSVWEIVAACERVTGKEIPREVVARRPGDAPALVADPSKLQSTLGWQPVYTDIARTIETAWAWHKAKPDGYGPRKKG